MADKHSNVIDLVARLARKLPPVPDDPHLQLLVREFANEWAVATTHFPAGSALFEVVEKAELTADVLSGRVEVTGTDALRYAFVGWMVARAPNVASALLPDDGA